MLRACFLRVLFLHNLLLP